MDHWAHTAGRFGGGGGVQKDDVFSLQCAFHTCTPGMLWVGGGLDGGRGPGLSEYRLAKVLHNMHACLWVVAKAIQTQQEAGSVSGTLTKNRVG